MLKIKKIFARVWSFAKKHLGLIIAIFFIILAAIFFKLISVLLAEINLRIILRYGYLSGGIRIFGYLTSLSLIFLILYFFCKKKILKTLHFFEIEIKGLERKEKIHKLTLIFLTIFVFFISLPAIFVIYLKNIFNGIQVIWLAILFFLSNLVTSLIAILGASVLGSSPIFFYTIVVLILIATIYRKIKKKLKEKSTLD